MLSYSKVFLLGYLTQDPVLRSTTSGVTFCTTTIALNRRYKASDGTFREETAFVELVANGRVADNMQRFTRKGMPVFIEGRLSQHSWISRSNEKMTKLRVSVDGLRMLTERGTVEDVMEPRPVPGMSLAPLTPTRMPVEPLRRQPAVTSAPDQVPLEGADSPRLTENDVGNDVIPF